MARLREILAGIEARPSLSDPGLARAQQAVVTPGVRRRGLHGVTGDCWGLMILLALGPPIPCPWTRLSWPSTVAMVSWLRRCLVHLREPWRSAA